MIRTTKKKSSFRPAIVTAAYTGLIWGGLFDRESIELGCGKTAGEFLRPLPDLKVFVRNVKKLLHPNNKTRTQGVIGWEKKKRSKIIEI